MKSNTLIIRLILLAALIAVIVYVARNTYWDEVAVPMPLRGEAVTNPFYAVQQFATELGANTEWRQTLGTLPEHDTVIFLSNWHWDLIEGRRAQLEQWVARGGRIVLDRSLIGGDEHLESWAGIRRDYPDYDDEDEDEDEADADAAEESSEAVEPDAEPPSDAAEDGSCDALHIVVNGAIANPSDTLSMCTLDGYTFLQTDRDVAWGLRDTQDALQAVRVSVGRGSVTSINALPFGNRELTEMDHGELFVAAAQLRRGDHVIFISEQDHPSLLSLMWTYGAPVVVLVLLTLAALLWRGGARFGPLGAATDIARRSLAEQIRGTGQFTIRLGGGTALHAAAVRALLEVARRKLPGYAGLAQPERIAAIAQASGVDADALASAVNHGGARRPGELAQTIALLENARRRLLE